MAIQPWVLEMLVCPESKKPLIYFEQEAFFFCPSSRLKYTIEDDIPSLVIEAAERLDPAAAENLVQEARRRGLPNAS